MAGIDNLIVQFDKALRASSGNVGSSNRKTPSASVPESELSTDERRLAGRLMRVNHCGEVCAQALYHGQALTAKTGRVSNAMLKAAEEETDHLVWCEERLNELGTSTSKLNPLWYASSYAMGAITGLLGDKINLGFVAATEEQVCKHLDEHLERLPEADERSRSILKAMRQDEKQHEQSALSQGGAHFPTPIKSLMTGVSNLMTRSSFWA